MRKLLVAAVATVAAWAGAAAGTARAQVMPYGPSSIRSFDATNGPTLSPYLNLGRGGSPSANYYLGVIPEFQRRYFENLSLNNFQALNRRTTQTQDEVEALAAQPVLRTLTPTGHPTGFLNYGSYYSSLNRR